MAGFVFVPEGGASIGWVLSAFLAMLVVVLAFMKMLPLEWALLTLAVASHRL